MKQTKRNSQTEKFIEAARALECDESEERFDAALRKIADHKPLKEPKVKKSKMATAHKATNE